ncbi:class F sortase [Nesterenkonia sp. AY15]|uniref:class F sortase n=1 Tax=Nesterenkonia sp. AY15 TaxID=2901139 RepID=UPI001F4C9BA9|nr:class F sortase [Nesterenkonia sp. AY15]MCH8572185.1 class F sortase [Nesterenkonia sp. AY15]
MSPLPRHHHETTCAASGGRHRGAALAVATALMLAISACSPGQDDDPGAAEDTATAVVESEAGTPEADEPAETDATNDEEGESEASPTPTPAPDEADGPEDAKDQSNEAATETAPPAAFEIPAIDASSELLHLGLRDNGTLEVPPGDPGSPASWYTGSPAPGDQGPSVLLGHVDDSLGEPGVFADLPELVEGDEITVGQEDGGTATFVVTKAEQYGKNTFPTLEVYGNTEDPELRLITCDGYDQATGEYEDNYVVYATLVG